MPRCMLIAGLATLACLGALQAQPVTVDPTNPHYLSYHGKPIILITSAEHYGAVINGEFDFIRYLDALAKYGLNYTRIYPGYLFEPMGKFLPGNTLGAQPPLSGPEPVWRAVRALHPPWQRGGWWILYRNTRKLSGNSSYRFTAG